MKYDEKLDEVKIQTADISNKFQFFETYKPSANQRKAFRITPPRDGVVKMPDADEEVDEINSNGNYIDASATAAQKSSTASRMLNVFRQMEENEHRHRPNEGLKPLKSFTPPLDGGRRLVGEESESGSDSDNSDEERHVDEELRQAQAAARAQKLRAKFERWESSEVQREQPQLYDGCDESQIESTRE